MMLEDLVYGTFAQRTFFHSMHHSSKGVSFVGDHDLFEDIYELLNDHYDALTERSIGLFRNTNVQSPLNVLDKAAKIMYYIFSDYQISDPMVNPELHESRNRFVFENNSLNIAMYEENELKINNSITMLSIHLEEIENCYNSIKHSGSMTLGLDDLLMSQSSELEVYLYKLTQRSPNYLGQEPSPY
jgi:hypothetical protein